MIAKIEKAVREGGLFAFAMPRGSGKTTLARCAALWAVLYGYRPFICLIGAADDRAKELLLPIKKHMLENPLLLADFPEAIHPLRALENSSKRQQHCHGRLTHVHWDQNKLVFPTIEGFSGEGLAGPGVKMSAFLPCTVIVPSQGHEDPAEGAGAADGHHPMRALRQGHGCQSF